MYASSKHHKLFYPSREITYSSTSYFILYKQSIHSLTDNAKAGKANPNEFDFVRTFLTDATHYISNLSTIENNVRVYMSHSQRYTLRCHSLCDAPSSQH